MIENLKDYSHLNNISMIIQELLLNLHFMGHVSVIASHLYHHPNYLTHTIAHLLHLTITHQEDKIHLDLG